MCCLCLWSTGPPLHCSSSSSSPVEQLPCPPPSIAANDSQGRLLGNSAAQPAQDSDSEDEFGPDSFLVKTGSGTLCDPATADAHGELVFKLLLLFCSGRAYKQKNKIMFSVHRHHEEQSLSSICSLRKFSEPAKERSSKLRASFQKMDDFGSSEEICHR